MALMALGTAVLMTAVAVAIGGLALEMILFAISRSLTARVEMKVEQAGMSNVNLLTSDSSMNGWAEELAA